MSYNKGYLCYMQRCTHLPAWKASSCWLVVQVNLKRERLELSPVYSTAMDHDGHKLGYIRLVNFSQKAAFDMRRAIDDLQVRRDATCATRHELPGSAVLDVDLRTACCPCSLRA